VCRDWADQSRLNESNVQRRRRCQNDAIFPEAQQSFGVNTRSAGELGPQVVTASRTFREALKTNKASENPRNNFWAEEAITFEASSSVKQGFEIFRFAGGKMGTAQGPAARFAPRRSHDIGKLAVPEIAS
jgi:hypothetical protein